MIERKKYTIANRHTFFKIWTLSLWCWVSVIVVLLSRDGGMTVLGVALAFTLFCATCKQLNTLVGYKDDRFMVNAIFWIGSIAFNVTGIALRNSIGNVLLVLGVAFFNALVILTVIFYITGTGKTIAIQNQKALD